LAQWLATMLSAENCVSLLKENRRIATRYEKTAGNYLSMIQLGYIQLLICN
jgi:transposase